MGNKYKKETKMFKKLLSLAVLLLTTNTSAIKLDTQSDLTQQIKLSKWGLDAAFVETKLGE